MGSKREAMLFDTVTTQDVQGGNRSREEQEEKLILTAWQSMSSALQQQQHGLSEASRAVGPAQSFLSRQRQWTQARRVLGGVQPSHQGEQGCRGRNAFSVIFFTD